MESHLTFGEYMRRLRRLRKWSLHTLAEESGISYTHLSRLENESTLPRAESVARLAQALGGDLRAMLEMADCLPKLILDRINSQEQEATSLKRAAGLPGNTPEELVAGRDDKMVSELKRAYNLTDEEAGTLAHAIDGLVSLENSRRSSVINLINSLSAHEGTAG